MNNELLKFKLIQIKLTHYYFNDGDIIPGYPFSTSIELTSLLNNEMKQIDWKKKITNTCYNDKKSGQHTIYEKYEPINTSVIELIENNNLINLKNNYFTNKAPDNFSHWELNYNNYFNIVGTYDQNTIEIENIMTLLNFKQTINIESEAIIENIKQNNGNNI